MADLVLTQNEKEAGHWHELDDATIGKVVKASIAGIIDLSEEQQIWSYSAALLLCSLAADANADTLTTEIHGLMYQGKAFGDWRVHIARIE